MKKPQPVSSLFSRSQKGRFRKSLLAWYALHRRDLPWRANRDPYRVWLSEIMLQQTRVAAVIEHYQEFLRRFPTVQKLATAREASVLAAWSGLGYYRRARMLHAAAKVIVREHGGKFPCTAETLRTLPGVGRYTAAAIASIAFDQPAAVVDGNVERVLQRVLGKRAAEEELWEAANRLLDKSRSGDFNQAMMELGATVCTPRAPACLTCPVMQLCATRGELKATTRAAPQKRCEIHYALDYRNGDGRDEDVFLVQRPPDASLMPGMWELPEIVRQEMGESEQRVPPARFAPHGNDEAIGCPDHAASPSPSFTLRHSITLTNYTVYVWRVAAALSPAVGKWTSVERLKQVALTGLARKILRKAEFI